MHVERLPETLNSMNTAAPMSDALFGGGGLLAQNVPGDVGAELLTENRFAESLCLALNHRAPFGWNVASGLPHAG